MDHAKALGRSKLAPTEFLEFPNSLANVFDLIYTGNADFAREYTRVSFKGHEEKRLGFLIELALDVGHYSDSEKITEGILKLNGCETMSELLIGKAGRFGRW